MMLTELLARRYGADIGDRIEKLYWGDGLPLQLHFRSTKKKKVEGLI